MAQTNLTVLLDKGSDSAIEPSQDASSSTPRIILHAAVHSDDSFQQTRRLAANDDASGDESHSESLGAAGGPAAPTADVVQLRVAPAARPGEVSKRVSHHWKRVLDVAIAGPALLVLLPLLAALWVAVRLTSPGPGLHWSARVGAHGRTFKMPKLRTMVKDSPQVAREQLVGGADLTTPLGKHLRRLSLDELPQLYSVLIGDMGLIGPRPLMPCDPGAAARSRFAVAMAVRPGLSGLAQVKGRNLVTPTRKARYDAFYARRAGVRLDLWLIGVTLKVLFRRCGGGVLLH
jgi:O-antigen biosynthesis protein WbqP